MKKFLLIIIALIVISAGVIGWIYSQPLKEYVNNAVVKDDLPDTNTSNDEIRITDGVKHSIFLEDLVSGGPPKDGIPSIDNPKFESVTDADSYLNDELLGVGIIDGDEQRFYPFQILVWHEIANDTINGTPVLVTFCPLCGTAVVFDRRLDGVTHEFGVSGKLYNSNLVMYDRESDSYWSQASGKAIVGERTGNELELYPFFENVKWGDWKARYPNGKVLSRETGYIRDYTRTPYSDYENSPSVWFPVANEDDRLAPKTWITGMTIDNVTKAYPMERITKERVVNDVLGDTPILVVKDPQNGIKAFKRERRTFSIDESNRLIDNETQSVWNYDGLATNGTLAGTELPRVQTIPSFWFSWVAFYPETILFE
ncbi:MAG: DUF3179 domain-containing protein [bacterium]|nr:DUF3179 domain-containing protein [bacterium]